MREQAIKDRVNHYLQRLIDITQFDYKSKDLFKLNMDDKFEILVANELKLNKYYMDNRLTRDPYNQNEWKAMRL